MPESPFFERASEALERETALSRLEARGALRLALKAAGFDPSSANRPQVLATVLHSLPDVLRRQGVADFEPVCDRVAEKLAAE